MTGAGSQENGREDRFHAIFDSAAIAVYEMSLDGRFLTANPSFCGLVGYTADELCSLQMRDIVHPDDLAAEIQRSERLLAGEITSYVVEKRLRRKDGEFVWVEVSRAAVRAADGAPLGLVGVARDLTAQRQAEAKVSALNAELEARVGQRTAELEQVNKDLQAFTYSVSHDLRAPLRAVSGFADALVEDCGAGLDEAGRDYVERIQAASQRMTALIEDLLQLSRVSRAVKNLNLGPVDLSAEAAGVWAELRAREPGRDVRFRVQEGIVVTADRVLIRTVLQNLLENALKFTARRPDASVEVGSMPAEGAQACYFVRDSGAGFDPAYAGKLFQAFERLHSVTEFPGTGVGLASVRQIIERHSGRVWAEGRVNEGATFYFTLNAHRASG